MIFPLNSSAERTSTSCAVDFFSTAARTSSRLARIAAFAAFTLYVVAETAGFWVVNGRLSSSHFLRPPLMIKTFSWP